MCNFFFIRVSTSLRDLSRLSSGDRCRPRGDQTDRWTHRNPRDPFSDLSGFTENGKNFFCLIVELKLELLHVQCREVVNLWLESQTPSVSRGCEFESRAGRNCRWGVSVQRSLHPQYHDEVPLSKALNPLTLAAHCSGCVYVCVFTAVCALWMG